MFLEDYLNFHIIAFIFSFMATMISVPWIIPKLTSRSLVGIDMNKIDKPKIPEMGGIVVVTGFFMGVYVQLLIFEIWNVGYEISSLLFASIIAIIGISLVGIIDDLLSMRQHLKAFLHFVFALPIGLFVSEEMFIPFMGNINFGILIYFIVPFGVTCAANSMNMLEGFNGLGVGMGIIVTSSLIVLSIQNEQYETQNFQV